MLNRVMWEGRLLPGKAKNISSGTTASGLKWSRISSFRGSATTPSFCRETAFFGYYECEDLEKRDAVKAVNAAQKRWAASMQGIVDLSQPHPFRQVFYLE